MDSGFRRNDEFYGFSAFYEVTKIVRGEDPAKGGMLLRNLMPIQVHLFAYLAKFSPTGREKFTLDPGPEETVGQLLEKLGIPPDFEKRVLVNGRHAEPSTFLSEGDEVFIYPPAAGG